MSTHNTLLAALGLLLAPGSLAFGLSDPELSDPEHRQDPASSLAIGISLRSDLICLPAPSPVRFKGPGSQPAVPALWAGPSSSGEPDYSHSAMFGVFESLVQIDAMSIGSDTIPAPLEPGIPEITANGRWLGVVVSVKNGANGLEGSLIERASLNGRPNGSDLFAHYFEESLVIHSSLAGATLLSQSRESMGYSSSGLEDIDALDFAMGAHTFAPGVGGDPLFRESNDFYFSVTGCSAGQLVGVWEMPPGQVHVVHEANIYKMTWSGTAWGPVELYRSWCELGLTELDDVDALAVDPLNSTLVYSTAGIAANAPQLVLHYRDPQSGPYSNPCQSMAGITNDPLMSNTVSGNGGTPVVRSLGGADDTADIDAVSILDPKEDEKSAFFATPVGVVSLPGLATPMGLSVARSTPGGQRFGTPNINALHFQLSGRRGPAGMPTIVQFIGASDYDEGLSWNQATWVGIGPPLPRFDDGTEGANVFDYIFPIPTQLTGGTLAVGALVFDPATGAIIGGSWVSEINL